MSDLSDADRKRIKQKLDEEKRETRRTRRQTWLAGTLIVAAVGIGGGTLFLLTKAHAKPGRDEIIAAQSARIRERQAELDREDLVQARIDKAKEMREHWRPWAMAHLGVLRRMYHAAPGDKDALAQAYAELPSHLWKDRAGITDDDMNSRGMPFTWQPFMKIVESPKMRPITDPKLAAWDKKGRDSSHKRLTNDFAQYHDIALSYSSNPGSIQICLWASGRITRQQDHLKRVPRGEMLVRGEHQEVVPPFDEIAN